MCIRDSKVRLREDTYNKNETILVLRVFFCTLLPNWYQNAAILEEFVRRETSKTTEDNIHLEYTPGTNYSCDILWSSMFLFVFCFLSLAFYLAPVMKNMLIRTLSLPMLQARSGVNSLLTASNAWNGIIFYGNHKNKFCWLVLIVSYVVPGIINIVPGT